MKLTNPEKLILIMLSEIYEKLDIDGYSGVDPKFVKSAIFSGNTWGLEWEYTGIFSDQTEPTPPEVSEVVNYLDMWCFIEEAYEKLDDADRKLLEEEAAPFGKFVSFAGFDGNNESEYMGIARFLINDLKRFVRFEARDLNSHAPSLGMYRRMYQIFEPIRRNLIGRRLSRNELVAILSAKQRLGD